MPIIIRNAEWRETESSISVKIPSRGVPCSKVNLFCSKGYIKASYDQYFFEAVLFDEIDVNRTTCTVLANFIVFESFKLKQSLWGRLERDVDKPEQLKLKKFYIDEEHERLQKESAERLDKKHELKRVAVREQISLDSKQRRAIEDVKTYEKIKALDSVNVWSKCEESKLAEEVKELPKLRQGGVVYVEFTPREFPTPCRESKLDEENEWLRKQAEARRTAGFISDDIRPEERNPQFLKAKGDEFIKNQNYLGAISAYSFGIKLNNKFADLYIARSEAHLCLGNFSKVAQDCSKALDLMKPEVSLNLEQRALCIGRRGIALVNLGIVQQGISEIKASLNLVPNDSFAEELKKAQERLENMEEISD